MRLPSLLALTVLLAASLPSSAQVNDPPTFEVGEPVLSMPTIRADLDTATVDVPWTYTLTPAQAVEGAAQPSYTINWHQPTCDQPGIIITGASTQAFDAASPPETTTTGKSTFNIQATQDAPGEMAITCTFAGQVGAHGAVTPPSTVGSGDVNVVVSYLGLITARALQSIGTAMPQSTVDFDIEVANFGNSRTGVHFSVEGDIPAGWVPVAPQAIVLDAQGTDAAKQVVTFQVRTPFREGHNSGEATFRLAVTPVSVTDASQEGQPQMLNFLARVEGTYLGPNGGSDNSSPAAGILVVLGLLGAAMVARRR